MLASQSERFFFPQQPIRQFVLYFMSVPFPQQRGLFQCWLSVFPYQLITCCVGQKWDIFHASNILSTHSDCVYLTDGPLIGQSGILSIPVKSWALHVPIPVVHFVHQSGIFCIPVTISCLSVPMLIVDLLVTVGYFPCPCFLQRTIMFPYLSLIHIWRCRRGP